MVNTKFYFKENGEYGLAGLYIIRQKFFNRFSQKIEIVFEEIKFVRHKTRNSFRDIEIFQKPYKLRVSKACAASTFNCVDENQLVDLVAENITRFFYTVDFQKNKLEGGVHFESMGPGSATDFAAYSHGPQKYVGIPKILKISKKDFWDKLSKSGYGLYCSEY